MWVQLLTVKNISVRGKSKTFHPGDWVDVGKHDAQLWISRNEACLPKIQDHFDVPIDGAGILTNDISNIRQQLKGIQYPIEKFYENEPAIPYERTVIIDYRLKIRPVFVSIGLSLLNTWEIAAPIYDYDRLAVHVGTDEERQQTKEIIRDLRVPLYDIRLMFVKRTETTKQIFDEWTKEPGDRMLAFLRALYRNPCFILALPITWTGRHVTN